MIFVLSYPLPYSLIITILYPCENNFNFNAILCGGVCYLFGSTLGIITWAAFMLVPMFLIVLSHLFLCLKLYREKPGLVQNSTWKKKKPNIATTFNINWIALYIMVAIQSYSWGQCHVL